LHGSMVESAHEWHIIKYDERQQILGIESNCMGKHDIMHKARQFRVYFDCCWEIFRRIFKGYFLLYLPSEKTPIEQFEEDFHMPELRALPQNVGDAYWTYGI